MRCNCSCHMCECIRAFFYRIFTGGGNVLKGHSKWLKRAALYIYIYIYQYLFIHMVAH